jgi:hypothetical protein
MSVGYQVLEKSQVFAYLETNNIFAINLYFKTGYFLTIRTVNMHDFMHNPAQVPVPNLKGAL